MTRAETLLWLSHCAYLAARGAPLTEVERARHRSLCADEDARAAARRAEPTPQLALPKVA